MTQVVFSVFSLFLLLDLESLVEPSFNHLERLSTKSKSMVSGAFWALFVALASPLGMCHGRILSLEDMQSIVDELGDEILTHDNLNPGRNPANMPSNGLLNQDLNEDTFDLDEEEIPHPVGLHNWGAHLDLGQISGVAVNANDEPVVVTRGCHEWNANTFDQKYQLTERKPVPNDTIVTLDPESGAVKSSWGANMLYMPHGIAVDNDGNTFVTDVGLHQVFRFPAGSSKPDITLGEAFVPGSDEKHFCQPTSVAVSDVTGIFFVADGYCNSRVLKYDRTGKLLKIIDGNWNVVHSLALFEEDDVLCLSDREGQKIDCIRAGLVLTTRPQEDETGTEVLKLTGVGRSYGIASKGTSLLSVTGAPNAHGITIDTASDVPKIVDKWGFQEGLVSPHAVAISKTGDAVYVVDIHSDEKIRKFEVVQTPDMF